MNTEQTKAMILLNRYVYPQEFDEFEHADILALQVEYMNDHDLFQLANQNFKTRDLEVSKVPLISDFVRYELARRGYNRAIM